MGTVEQEEKEADPEEEERQERIKRMPILDQCYNLLDFEAVAREVMKKTAWAYYSSGADDEIVCSSLWFNLSSKATANIHLLDTSRKSLCISQDLVPSPGSGRR